MTLDEALEKVVLGYFARHDGMASNAYIYYEFQGWRMGFNHDGRIGSSSNWWADETDLEANWYITNAIVPAAWGNFQTICWDIEAAVDVPPEIHGEVYPEDEPVTEGWPIFNNGN